VRAAGEAGSRREEAGGGSCTPRAPGRRYAAGPLGSRAQHACASGTRARRASTRAAGARAVGIRRRSLGLPEVQLGQGRQPVGRRNRGDRWGAGIMRAAGGRTAEEVRRARQGGGQREAAGRLAAACAGSLTHGAEVGGGGREEARRAGRRCRGTRRGARRRQGGGRARRELGPPSQIWIEMAGGG